MKGKMMLAIVAGMVAQTALAAPVLQDFVVFGNTSVTIGNNVGSAPVSLGGNGTASLGNNSDVGDIVFRGNVGIGNNSTVTGGVRSGGDIAVGNNSEITGTAQASGTVTLGNNKTTVGSAVTGASAPALITLPSATVFTAGGADQSIANNGTLNLLAGTYGALSTGNNVTLNLSAGEYYFDAFTLGNNVDLNLDLGLGGITIYIVGALTTTGNNFDMTLIGGDVSDVLFEVHGDATIGNGNDWFGTIFAPVAGTKVTFGNNLELTGAIYGDTIIIGNNVTLIHDSSSMLFRSSVVSVPEPASLALLGLGLVGLGVARRRRSD